MKNFKAIFLAVALMLATVFTAQAQTEYQPDWKYNFFSNWTVSASVIGAKTTDFTNFTLGEGTNIGADLRLSKRIANYWDLRYMVEVPGFINNHPESPEHFDRYGKALAGIEFHPVRWFYLFADAGTSYNPDNINKLGVATDAGLGLSFKTSNWTRTYLEVGADRCQNVATNQLNHWHSNFFAKLGFAVSLGITDGDYRGITDRNHQVEQLAKLESENAVLLGTNATLTETNDKLSNVLETTTKTCQYLESELNDCRENCGKNEEIHTELFQIYFPYASQRLEQIELDKITMVYSRMNPDVTYTIHGYCSDNGDDHRNQVLSEKRAQAVKAELVRLGANPDHLNTVGHGRVAGGNGPLNQMVEITW